MTETQRAFLQRRLKRWEMWGSLWLQRLFALLQFVCGEPRGALRDWFDAKIRLVSENIIATFVIHAALGVKIKYARSFYDPRKRRNNFGLRVVIGGHLRRAFKAKTILGRLEKIRRAVEQREALVARLAWRLRKGLTRAGQAHTRPLIGGDASGANALDLLPILAAGLMSAPDAIPDTS